MIRFLLLFFSFCSYSNFLYFPIFVFILNLSNNKNDSYYLVDSVKKNIFPFLYRDLAFWVMTIHYKRWTIYHCELYLHYVWRIKYIHTIHKEQCEKVKKRRRKLTYFPILSLVWSRFHVRNWILWDTWRFTSIMSRIDATYILFLSLYEWKK